MRLKGPLRRSPSAISKLKKARELTIRYMEKTGTYHRRHLLRLAKLDRMIQAAQTAHHVRSLTIATEQLIREAETMRLMNQAEMSRYPFPIKDKASDN